jgi:hypothetical protein
VASGSDSGPGVAVSSSEPPANAGAKAHQPKDTPVPSATHGQDFQPGEPSPTVSDYGVLGAGANLRLMHSQSGGRPVIRVTLAHDGSNFSLDAAGDVLAVRVGAQYRIGAWLRTKVPGLTLCLRIKEVSPKDPLTSVRTTETCMSPTTKWRHFRIMRTTIARGDKLVFSIYTYDAVKGDSFDIKRFTVMRRTVDGWKRVPAAFADKNSTF